MKMLGSDAILRSLEAEGVDVAFGIPGGAVLPTYDAFARGTSVRHVLARHEQGAGHMAEGYARASGKVGVVLATSGPGATNLVTPIANAAMDSTPLVCVTGQVRSALLGSDAFQECDAIGITLPLVKHSWLVRDVGELRAVLKAAFHLARSGRPGPVLVDVPRDVQEAAIEFDHPAQTPRRPATSPAPGLEQVERVVDLIEAARRPVLYVGGGAVNAGATDALRELAEAAEIPVVTTLMGKGAFPESHELFAGWPGMHGAKWANWALNKADLVLAIGARFDDRVTGRLDDFAARARVAHFDIDPYEIGKIRRPDVAVVAPLRDALSSLRGRLRGAPRTREWLAEIDEWRMRFPLRYAVADGVLKPQQVLEHLETAAQGEVIWTTGVGQHQMWAMQYLTCERPRRFITSGGHGTMGFGLPAAIGAKAAHPDATVICVDGDGSFQMTPQELATAVAEGLPVIVVIINNAGLGMVRQWQEMFYDGRLSQVELGAGPDHALVARGYGAEGHTVRSLAELDAAFGEALASGRTTVIDARVDPTEHCYPMIAPGAAAVDMIEWPGTSR